MGKITKLFIRKTLMDIAQMIIMGIIIVTTGVMAYTIGHFNGFMQGMNKCQKIYSPNANSTDA